MINFRLIRFSASPFLSRVLLVKQKDGSWHFCTTYRAFNVVTIKDRLLIPTVDDTLDEFYRATYFIKLDLWVRYHQV